MSEADKGLLNDPDAPWAKGTTNVTRDADLIEKEDKEGQGAIETAIQVLDYTGGVSRTALANALEKALGKELVTDKEEADGLRLSGSFPDSNTLMGRAGVPSGPTITTPEVTIPESIPFFGPYIGGVNLLEEHSFTPREVAGFAADIALDPATYGSFGIWPAMKIGGKPVGKAMLPLLRPGMAASTELLRRFMYRNGLKALDRAAELEGKGENAVSNAFWKNKWWGTNDTLYKKATDRGEQLTKEIEGIIDEAGKAGAVIDRQAAAKPAQAFSGEIRDNPYYTNKSDAMDAGIDELIDPKPVYNPITMTFDPAPPPSINKANTWKRRFYKDLQDAYGQFSTPTVTQDFKKAAARGLKNEVEAAADRVIPGAGKEIQEKNAEAGLMFSILPTAEREAWKGNSKNMLTSVDPLFFGLGTMEGAGTKGVEWLAAKKAADLSKTSWLRTGIPMGVRNLYESQLVYPLLKRGIIQGSNSPWTLMDSSYETDVPWEQ